MHSMYSVNQMLFFGLKEKTFEYFHEKIFLFGDIFKLDHFQKYTLNYLCTKMV